MRLYLPSIKKIYLGSCAILLTFLEMVNALNLDTLFPNSQTVQGPFGEFRYKIRESRDKNPCNNEQILKIISIFIQCAGDNWNIGAIPKDFYGDEISETVQFFGSVMGIRHPDGKTFFEISHPECIVFRKEL